MTYDDLILLFQAMVIVAFLPYLVNFVLIQITKIAISIIPKKKG